MRVHERKNRPRAVERDRLPIRYDSTPPHQYRPVANPPTQSLIRGAVRCGFRYANGTHCGAFEDTPNHITRVGRR